MAQNTQRIVAHEPDAGALGLFMGQKLADARALIPTLDARPAEPEADADLLRQVARWCDRYTPLVGASDDGLMLDITGCAHLAGGEAALMAEIAARLRGQGFTARLGLADSIGAAWALARFGAPLARAEPGDAAPLMRLPLAALRLSDEVVTGLGRVGFKTVGCIAPLPRAPLAARFGEGLMRRLDQALGRAGETLSPLLPVAELSAEKAFAEPIAHTSDIDRAIALLAGSLVPLLEQRGMGARALELRLYRVDGAVPVLAVEAAQPLRDAERIAALFAQRLAGLAVEIDAGFGFDLVKLAVLRAEPFDGRQGELSGGPGRADRLEALVDRLGARLGADRVRGFVGADTHIPERAFGTLPVTRRRAGTPAAGPAAAIPAPPLTRPLYLLARPEPVEAMAQVPDGPPVRFRWRKVGYAAARSEGPERIACEWWRDGRRAPTRDYFRVEAEAGQRFWMFRHGLYAQEKPQPRWYMHGVFA